MRPDAPRPARVESRDISELRALRATHPELAPAIDLQLELCELQRRLQARVPTPLAPLSAAAVSARLQAGQRLLELSEVSFELADVRLSVRQTADALRRHDILDVEDHRRIVDLARQDDRFGAMIGAWYAESAVAPAGRPALAAHRADFPLALDQVLTLALRPFLARAADAVLPGAPLDTWQRPWCPLCGGEPDFAVVTADGRRLLTCSRCGTRWDWDVVACPWCEMRDPAQLVTFGSTDRRYRVYACNQCRRYLKAYDGRGASRPALPVVDAIVTLPLDAAAIQHGYGG